MKNRDWLVAQLDVETDDCIIWPFGTNGAYGVVCNKLAHREMCILAHGAPPTRLYQAAHKCGRTLCVNKKHLRWATPAQNQQDSFAHGTKALGEAHAHAKLTDAAVREIRSLGASQAIEMAYKYRVSGAAVQAVLAGRTWKHVQ